MIGLSDIEAARKRLDGHVKRTPTVKSDVLSQVAGSEVFVKLENQQHTGSFKERGALNKLLCLTDDEKRRGVIAASAGNHAQGVAFHASRNGIRATILMPETTPLIKVQNTHEHGARVVLHGANYDEAYAEARRLQEERSLTFIHPFDDELVIAGQGTIGLELLEAVPDLDAVIVPVGGGGLIAGIAVAIKAVRPEVQVFGVQAARAPSMLRSLEAGEPVTIQGGRTLADGIQVKRPGSRTFELVKQHVDRVKTVTESELADAIVFLLERQCTLAEGAGAAGVAAILKNHFPELRRSKIATIICGGNIDLPLLSLIIERNMVRSGRLMRITVQVPQRPGGLAELLTVVAEQEASVVQIDHHHTFTSSPFWEAEVALTLETRDARHAEEVRAGLKDAGYVIRARSDF
jgi:threonine dehydratase